MVELIFITSNQGKADLTAKWLDHPLDHKSLDLPEIQSLDIREVVEHKARQAYKLVRKPVLVEDVALTFTAMGRLPGTLIKWFEQELGLIGLCRLADNLEHRGATVTNCYAFFDGKDLQIFDATSEGKIAHEPRGEEGFGWNPIFIPEGSDKTFAEMDDEARKPFSARAKALKDLKAYLDSHGDKKS